MQNIGLQFGNKLKRIAQIYRPNDYKLQEDMWFLGYIYPCDLFLERTGKEIAGFLYSQGYKYTDILYSFINCEENNSIPFLIFMAGILTSKITSEEVIDIDIEEYLQELSERESEEVLNYYISIGKKIKSSKIIPF